MTTQAERKYSLPLVGLHDFCVLVGVIALFAMQMNHFADDPGVGWHLKTGEFIFTHHQIPDYDPFLAHGSTRSWISDQWLSDLLFYSVYQYGGWVLLYLTLALLYVTTYFGILYKGVARLTGSSVLGTLAAIFAFKMGQIHFIVRAPMVGFALFTLVLLVCQGVCRRIREAQTRVLSEVFPFVVLPPIFVLWANLHPSFVLGLILVGMLPIGFALDNLFFERTLSTSTIVRLFILALICGLATIANPFGIALHESIFRLGRSSYFMSLNEEWMSPDFHAMEGKLFLLYMALISIGVFVGGTVKLKWGFFEFGLLIVFAALGLQAVRILPFFSIAASIPLVTALINLENSRIFRVGEAFRPFLHRLRNIELRERRSTRGFLALVAILTLSGLGYLNDKALLFEGPFGPSNQRYPYGAVSAINAQSSIIQSVVVAPPEWGGFITFLGRRGVKPVIDDRNALLGEQFYKTFYEKLKPGTELLPYIQGLGATHLILRSDSSLTAWLVASGTLKKVYEDGLATLFLVPSPTPK